MTKEYDKALDAYFQKLKKIATPLYAWDLFAEHNLEINNYNIIQKNWSSKFNFRKKVYLENKAILITNAKQEIIFASEGIYRMNGYKPFEIIGKSPKIFQGKDTCKITTHKIRTAIQNQHPFKEKVLNYKKDGTAYLCEIEVFPKFNKNGEIVNYIAFEKIAS